MRYLSLSLALILAISVSFTACSPKRAETPAAAIEKAAEMEPEKALDYLLTQTQAFQKDGQYKDALSITTHIKRKMKVNSEEVQELRRSIKKDMEAARKAK